MASRIAEAARRPRGLSGRSWSGSSRSSHEDLACRRREKLAHEASLPVPRRLSQVRSPSCALARRAQLAAMTRTLRMVLGDQCSRSLSALEDLDPGQDRVLMAEVMAECTYVKHHPKKIVLVLSAMRHFAAALQARGVAVDYITLDDPANTGTLRGEMLRAVERHRPERIVLTEPGEWRLMDDMRRWHEEPVAEGGGPRGRYPRRHAVHVRGFTEFLSWARGRDGHPDGVLLSRDAASATAS